MLGDLANTLQQPPHSSLCSISTNAPPRNRNEILSTLSYHRPLHTHTHILPPTMTQCLPLWLALLVAHNCTHVQYGRRFSLPTSTDPIAKSIHVTTCLQLTKMTKLLNLMSGKQQECEQVSVYKRNFNSLSNSLKKQAASEDWINENN